MSDGIPLLDSWITKATVARDALAKAEECIRELEAELEHSNSLRETLWTQRDYQQARAEKAERERDDWKECAESMQQERDSAKARVAELEAERVEEQKRWLLEHETR